MNAQTLSDVFDAVYLREFSEFDGAPRHFFSLRHRRAMKKILYPQGAPSLSTSRRLPVKKRIIIAILVIILSLIGIAAGAQIYKGFAFKEMRGHNKLYAVNDKNAPETINTQYHLPSVPEGFELLFEDYGSYNIFVIYFEHFDERTLFFTQSVKNGFNINLDDEPICLEEMEIGGNLAYYFSYTNNGGVIVWDNKDYILEVGGDFTKEELKAFAESVELIGE